MATHDRYTLEPIVETITPAKREPSQGELFARIALRQLPVMKGAPEDFWVLPATDAPRTLH